MLIVAQHDPSKFDSAMTSEELAHVFAQPEPQNNKDRKDPFAEAAISRIAGGRISKKLGLGETPGERKFNALDWGGIGYGVNSAVSIALGHLARNGKLHQPIDWFNRTWMTPVFRLGKDVQSGPLVNHKANKNRYVKALTELGHKDVDTWTIDKIYRTAHSEKGLIDTSGANVCDKSLELGNMIRHAEDCERIVNFNTLEDHVSHALKNHLGEEAAADVDHWSVRRLFTTAKQKGIFEIPLHLNVPEQEAGKFIKDATRYLDAKRNAKLFTGFLMLGTGGWLLMAPVKWLEDHKSGIVKHFDANYAKHHNLSEAEVAAMQKRHQEIDAEPKQSWSSVLLSRATTYPLIMTSYMGLGREIHQNFISRASFGKGSFRGTDAIVGDSAEKITHFLETNAKTAPRLQKIADRLEAGSKAIENEFHAEGSSRFQKSFTANNGRKQVKDLIADTLTEVGYSAGMASMTFGASRVLGPILGDPQHRHHKKMQENGAANLNIPFANSNIPLREDAKPSTVVADRVLQGRALAAGGSQTRV